MLVRLNESGRTIVLITHEDEIAEYARRVVRLRDGRIVSDTAWDEARWYDEERAEAGT
jgi:putative ABC transport system ATP-binding protein